MPRYLADWMGGLLGFRPTDNDTEGATPEGYATALGGAGTVRGKPKTNLLDPDPTFYDEAGAYSEEPTAPLRMGGFSSGMGQPYRTPMPRGMAQAAAVGPRLQAPEIEPGGSMPPLEPRRQVAPHPMGPDVPMAPGVTAPRGPPGAGQPMPQQARGAQALMPSGAPNLLGKPPSKRGNLLGNSV